MVAYEGGETPKAAVVTAEPAKALADTKPNNKRNVTGLTRVRFLSKLVASDKTKVAKSASGRISEQKVGSSAMGGEEPKAERNKSFQRIRGFLKGSRSLRRSSKTGKAGEDGSETCSRRKNLAASTVASSGTQSPSAGDESTIFNVTLDDRSQATSVLPSDSASAASNLAKVSPSNPDGKYLLRMVLLLMDVATRRFELLQLEFDEEKALVSDVLTQVPVSVTEERLRSQKYSGIVTIDGEEMMPDKSLVEFCSGNDVLVAVPEGVEAKEAKRLAVPILSDKKVVRMLAESGLNAPGWAKDTQTASQPAVDEGKSDAKKDVDWSSSQIPDYGKVDSKIQLGGSLVFIGILLALLILVASMVHKYISTPLRPGHFVSPGVVLSRCGLNIWSKCDSAYLEVQSGMVSYYEGKELAWVIHGSKCPDEKSDDTACIDGLEFKADRSLALGGQPIKWVERHSATASEADQLVPWPFTEEPKIKSWHIAAGRVAGGASSMADDVMKSAEIIKNKAGSVAGRAAERFTNKTAAAAGKLANSTMEAAQKLANGTVAAADKVKARARRLKDETAERIKATVERFKAGSVMSK